MKVFYFMGNNPQNQSGVSWKIWKIERKGKQVTVLWGRAVIVNRKVVPSGRLQSKSWKYHTEEEAKDQERKRIKEEEGKGYERRPRI